MAGVIQRFEQRLEGAVTGAFARAFRSAVQPVEIAAALQREVDNSAHILSRERMLVPNDFTVELSPSDHGRLSQFSDTLSKELSRLVEEHVKEQRYTLAGPLSIGFAESAELSTGRFRVRSRTNASVTPVSGQRMTETAIRSSEVDHRGQRHEAPAHAARCRRRTGQQRRAADRRPRHLTPARADLAQRGRGWHRRHGVRPRIHERRDPQRPAGRRHVQGHRRLGDQARQHCHHHSHLTPGDTRPDAARVPECPSSRSP